MIMSYLHRIEMNNMQMRFQNKCSRYDVLPINAEAAELIQTIHACSSIETRADGRAVVDVVLAFAAGETARTLTGVVALGVEAGGAVFARIR